MNSDIRFEEPLKSSEGSTALKTRFRSAIDQLVEFGRAEKLDLVGYDSPELPLFEKLPDNVKEQGVLALEEYVDILSSTKATDSHLRYNLNTAWRALNTRGLVPCSDLFGPLEPTDMFEIYTLEGIQIFRSLNFFELCSYSLEELFATPWYELFKRDPEIDRLYMEMFRRLATGAVKTTEPIPVPEHMVLECFGRKKNVSSSKPLWISPLRDANGTLRAFAHVVRAKLISASN